MRRLVVFNHSAAESGGEIALRLLLEEISQDSMEVRAVLLESGPLEWSIRELGIDVDVVEMPESVSGVRRGRSFSKAPVDLYRFANSDALQAIDDGDVLYSNSQKAHVLALLRHRPSEQKWVVHQREYVSRRTLGLQAFVAAQWAAVRCDVCICNSVSTQRSVRLAAGHRSRVVPSAIRLEDFSSMRSLGSSDGAYRILVAATLTPQKGQNVLLAALPLVSTDRRLIIRIAGADSFGDSGYSEELHSLADRARRSNPNLEIEFLGLRSDVPSLMGSSDVLVAPSRLAEGMGQVVVQARAAGLPVIASDIPGYRDLVVPRVHGVLVPDGDSRALAAAISMHASGALKFPDISSDPCLHDYSAAATTMSVRRVLDSL